MNQDNPLFADLEKIYDWEVPSTGLERRREAIRAYLEREGADLIHGEVTLSEEMRIPSKDANISLPILVGNRYFSRGLESHQDSGLRYVVGIVNDKSERKLLVLSSKSFEIVERGSLEP